MAWRGAAWRYWQPHDYAVIAAFLALPAGEPFELAWDKVDRESIGRIEKDGRLAVFARALSGRISSYGFQLALDRRRGL